MDPIERWKENPFFVLGLPLSASQLDAERIARKLLAELELGLQAVRVAQTPLGPLERTPDRVRRALSELSRAESRAAHAAWARLPPSAAAAAESEACAALPHAMAFVGLRAC